MQRSHLPGRDIFGTLEVNNGFDKRSLELPAGRCYTATREGAKGESPPATWLVFQNPNKLLIDRDATIMNPSYINNRIT